jgi:hypothetical protein
MRRVWRDSGVRKVEGDHSAIPSRYMIYCDLQSSGLQSASISLVIEGENATARNERTSGWMDPRSAKNEGEKTQDEMK